MPATEVVVAKTWKSILGMLEQQVSRPTFANYLRSVQPVSLSDGILVIAAPNGFVKDWLLKRFAKPMEQIASAAAGIPVKVKVEVTAPGGESRPTPGPLSAPGDVRSDSQRTHPNEDELSSSLFNPRYTFENFVVGRSNQLSHAAAEQVAKQPARLYNPLFIYGGVGLGKTHLMHAIAHYVLQHDPLASVVYVPAETFLYHYVTSLREDRMAAFRRMYRTVDIWLVDDVQFISGRERTEAEFFQIFNALYDTHKQIVICSDRPPKELNLTEQRLVSRFEWGMICNIEPPDEDHRIAILQKKAQEEKVQVPLNVIECIAERIRSNVRTLEGALTRVLAEVSLSKRELTIDLALEVIRHYSTADDRKTVTIEAIMKVVCDHYRLGLSDMTGKKRNKSVVLPRQIAMYLTRELTDLSFPDIAHVFGGRDHTTVIHACEKIKRELGKDPGLKSTVDELRKRCEI